MERWRWMPEDLGSVYVWNNSPEFMLYVVKDGKTIYSDKTLVGTSKYATPVFDADMTSIIFNPDWVAPETVLVENLLPPLPRRKLLDPQGSQTVGKLQRQADRPAQHRLGPVEHQGFHLYSEERARQRAREGEILVPKQAHRLHARHASLSEEILRQAGARDRT
jgi:hypothetical protein